MIIKNFDQFILLNEAYGVSKSSVIFADLIKTSLISEFEEFLNSDKDLHKMNLTFKYTNLKTYIKDVELWKDFPVKEIKLEYVFKKTPLEKFKRNRPKAYDKGLRYLTTGSAHPFGNKNWTGYYSKIVSPIKKDTEHSLVISQDYGIEIIKEYSNSINLNSSDFIADIKSLIYHELNHTYETYKKILSSRKKGEGKTIRDIGLDVSLTWADVNKWGIPTNIYKKWSDEFGYKVYYMERHEMRAKVQESAPYAEIYSFEKFKEKCPAYEIAEDMINFDTNTFLSEMTDVILEYDPESDVDYVLNKLKNMFMTLYEKNLKLFREQDKLDINKLKNMSITEFVEYWRKKINISGEDLKRRLNNQWYKINSDKNEEI